MGKKQARVEGERAYGRIALSELSAERVADWTVRAVAGETRQFAKPALEMENGDVATTTTTTAPAMGALSIDTIVSQRMQPSVGLRCGSCEVAAFESLDDQYAHFKSDWHCANLKRRGKGAATLSQSEYELKAAARGTGSRSASSSESDTGSGSSEDDDGAGDAVVATTSEPVVEFTDSKSVFKIFKSILPGAGTDEFNPYTSLDQIRRSKFRWAVFLLRSGRFAGAIFDKERALCHKTIQRYTTRRKQGGSQAVHDSAGGKAKSAGATLRRYNEEQLKRDVADVLMQWAEQLNDCELVFISCGRTDRPTFFTGKPAILQSDDPRLARIPFATFRPTFEEVCRVRSELCSVKFAPLSTVESPAVENHQARSKAKSKSKHKDAPTADGLALVASVDEAMNVEAKVEEAPHLIQLVLGGDVETVMAFVKESDDVDVNVVDSGFMTPLHHAVEQNSSSLVQTLLEHGANPSLLDLRNRPPYFLCSTKEMRNVFRRYMAAHPDAWDYAASQIPIGLTEEMEQKKREKEAEKRRRARERKKQQKRDDAEKQRQEEEAAVEAEKKIAAGLACDSCGNYAGKSPFKRLEFKYCSTDCVNAHRRKLMSEAALKRLGG